MQVYKCTNCNEIFDKPKTTYESHGLNCPPYEKILVCPNCYCNDFYEVKDNGKL